MERAAGGESGTGGRRIEALPCPGAVALGASGPALPRDRVGPANAAGADFLSAMWAVAIYDAWAHVGARLAGSVLTTRRAPAIINTTERATRDCPCPVNAVNGASVALYFLMKI